MSIEGVNILVPGRGMVNSAAERVNTAVMGYDERLRFGYNEANGDWIVYIKMPRDFEAYYFIEGEPVYPVLGFGFEIPTVDDVLYKLHQADSWKHGHKILQKMNDSNAAIRHDIEVEMDQRTQEVAERIELELRREGKSPITRVFMHRRKPRG